MEPEIKPAFTEASIEEFEALAQQALATIPEELARHIKGVLIRIVDFPDDDTQARMNLASPYHILGLYRGLPIIRKSVNWVSPYADMIFLYRRPILEYCRRSGENLADVVRHVMIHEVGHHFGFSDADMKRIEAAE